jgi:hypothetical protein
MIVEVSAQWDGPAADVLWLLVQPLADLWVVDPVAFGVSLLVALGEDEAPTGALAGVEVLDFLTFEAWESLPALDQLWRLPDADPAPLAEVLRRVQADVQASQGGTQLRLMGDGAG